MQLDDAHKERVSKELTLKLAQALREGKISSVDLPVAAQFIRGNIYKIKTKEELAEFLKQLTERWIFFADILELELGREVEKNEKEKIQEIEQLIKAKKIDQAITEADKLTQNK